MVYQPTYQKFDEEQKNLLVIEIFSNLTFPNQIKSLKLEKKPTSCEGEGSHGYDAMDWQITRELENGARKQIHMISEAICFCWNMVEISSQGI